MLTVRVCCVLYCSTSGETGCFSKDRKEQGYAEKLFLKYFLRHLRLFVAYLRNLPQQPERSNIREDRATSISSYKIANNAMVIVVLPTGKASRHKVSLPFLLNNALWPKYILSSSGRV